VFSHSTPLHRIELGIRVNLKPEIGDKGAGTISAVHGDTVTVQWDSGDMDEKVPVGEDGQYFLVPKDNGQRGGDAAYSSFTSMPKENAYSSRPPVPPLPIRSQSPAPNYSSQYSNPPNQYDAASSKITSVQNMSNYSSVSYVTSPRQYVPDRNSIDGLSLRPTQSPVQYATFSSNSTASWMEQSTRPQQAQQSPRSVALSMSVRACVCVCLFIPPSLSFLHMCTRRVVHLSPRVMQTRPAQEVPTRSTPRERPRPPPATREAKDRVDLSLGLWDQVGSRILRISYTQIIILH
jgi:hypothetical protein